MILIALPAGFLCGLVILACIITGSLIAIPAGIACAIMFRTPVPLAFTGAGLAFWMWGFLWW